MKTAKAFGLGTILFSVSLVLAGGGVGIPKKEDVPKYLNQLLKSNVGADRAKAAEMLGKRGGINADDVEEAVEPLRKALQKDIDAKVRAAAARALGDIHTQPEDTVPILIDRLRTDDKMDVKLAIVVALGQYGPDAKDAVKPLQDLAKKFDAKKSKEGQTIQNSIQLITMKKKKKG
jgi:HEAT repeat protein